MSARGGSGAVSVRAALRAVALAAFAAAAASAAPPELASGVFRGDADLVLGEKIHAGFPSTAPGPHRFTFYAIIGTVVSAAAKKDEGTALTPRVRLTTPSGERVDGT